MDCSPPGSSVHGIFQARVLEWDAIALSGVETILFHKTVSESFLDKEGVAIIILCSINEKYFKDSFVTHYIY